MQFYKSTTNITPLSTSYIGDADVSFIKDKAKSEEGFVYFTEKYLSDVLDNKINNYSSLYLTDEKRFTDIANVLHISNPSSNIFTTTLYCLNSEEFLIKRDITSTLLSAYSVSIDGKYVKDVDKLFEIHFLDSDVCTISQTHDKIKYYLSLNTEDIKFNIPTKFKFTSEYLDTFCNFRYLLDKPSNTLVLLKNINGNLNLIYLSAGNIVYTPNISSYKSLNFKVNYYIQDIYPKLDTSWVAYNPTHKNSYSIDKDKSVYGLKNNYLVSNQYTYISGDTVESNIFILKNQISNINYSYRGDNLHKTNFNEPSVQFRHYSKIFSGNDQELGSYGINLNYEFYNTDYILKTDQYNKIKTSKTLYPYQKININDLNWSKSGSIGGDNPYMADKIFFNQSNSIYGSQYICTWLYRNEYGECTWLDRYYKPDKTSYSTALQSVFDRKYSDDVIEMLDRKLNYTQYYDTPDIHNTLEEEYAHTPQTTRDALYGIPLFDKVSDFMIEPDKEYIYYRIGGGYVKSVLDTLSASLIEDGLSLLNFNGYPLTYDTGPDYTTYVLDGTRYAHIDNYSSINTGDHSFTLSLFLKSDNWNDDFGYQIFGNVMDKGFGLISDGKITPFITVQNKGAVFVYNTDFNLIDTASISAEGLGNITIREIYRTDHLDSFNVITNPYIIE